MSVEPVLPGERPHACHMDPMKVGPGDSQLRYLWAEICDLRRRLIDLEAENRVLRAKEVKE
jgi:hypothetical protein